MNLFNNLLISEYFKLKNNFNNCDLQFIKNLDYKNDIFNLYLELLNYIKFDEQLFKTNYT